LLLFSRTLVFFFVSAPHRLLPSSPTRRSSDLLMEPVMSPAPCPAVAGGPRALLRLEGAALFALATFLFWKTGTSWWLYAVLILRSEEHTSELQSLTNLVCRLLLEKKNTPQLHH